MKKPCVCGIVTMLCLGVAAGRAADDPLDAYNVVWTTPSKDFSGSMPLGNGDIGLNVWVEESGDLVLLISKTDAWSENGRLLKLGRLRLKLSPGLPVGEAFQQVLRLRAGEIVVHAGQRDKAVELRVWVDANRPVIRVEAQSPTPFDVQAALEVWSTRPPTLQRPIRRQQPVDGRLGTAWTIRCLVF